MFAIMRIPLREEGWVIRSLRDRLLELATGNNFSAAHQPYGNEREEYHDGRMRHT